MNRLARLAATCCLWATPVLAADPDAQTPSAAQLVEEIVEQESKVDEVRSLYLRFEIDVTLSPELIAELAAANEKRRPTASGSGGFENDVRPQRTEQLELAFDENRVRKFFRIDGDRQETTVFDGTQAVKQTKYLNTGKAEVERSDSPRQLCSHFFIDLAWPRVGPHAFWFQEDTLAATRARITGYAKDYLLLDEADFHGIACFVLENRAAPRRLHVGKRDRRLHGVTLYAVVQPVDAMQAASAAAGRTFAGENDLTAWLKLLSPAEREAYEVRLRAAKFARTVPQSEFFLDDYREIAPGFWFPARQEDAVFRMRTSPPAVAWRSQTRLVESKVDVALPDDLFVIPSPETK